MRYISDRYPLNYLAQVRPAPLQQNSAETGEKSAYAYIYRSLHRKNAGAGFVQIGLLLGLAACGSSGGSSAKTSTAKTSTGSVFILGSREQLADDLPAKPTDKTTEPETPSDQSTIIEKPPQITLTSSDRIAAPALKEGDLVESGSEIYSPDLSQDKLKFVYELTNADNNILFQIDSVTGSLSFKADTIPDFEALQTGYVVSFRANSDALIFSQDIQIPITDIDEAPSAMRLVVTTPNIPENNQAAVKLADIQFDDPDQKAVFLRNTASIADNAFFEIRKGTELWLKPTAPLDFETARQHSIIIKSDHSAHEQNFALTVSDINDTVSLQQLVLNVTQSAVFEGKSPKNEEGVLDGEGISSANHLSTAFLLDDNGIRVKEDKFKIEIHDSPLFEIKKNNQIWLKEEVKLDFETTLNHAYTLTVWVSGAPQLSKTFILNLVDIDEKPAKIIISSSQVEIQEGRTTAQKLAYISFDDDALGNNSVILSDEDLFFLQPAARQNTYELWLAGGRQLDFETQPLHSVALSFDGTGIGDVPADQLFFLQVADVDEPAMRLSFQYFVRQVGEGRTIPQRLATILFEDEDSKALFQNNAVSVADNPLFEIKNNNQLWLKEGIELDFETQTSHRVRVFYEDNRQVSAEFTLLVGDRDDAATGLHLIDSSLNQELLAAGQGAFLQIEEGVSQQTKLFEVAIEDDGLGTNIVTMSAQLAPFFEVLPTGDRLIMSVWLKAGQEIDYERFSSVDLELWLVNNPAASAKLHIQINNKDEAEVFAPWPAIPIEGEPITLPNLHDPDGALRIEGVRWFISANGIDGWRAVTIWQTDISYTPALSEVGQYLRVQVSYIDALDISKEIFTPASSAVKNTNNRPPIFTSDSEILLSEAITYQPTDRLYQAMIRPDVANSDVIFTLSGVDAGRLQINTQTGEIFFSSSTQPNADSRKTHYDVVVSARTRFEGLEQEASLAVRFTISDVNDEAPEITSPNTASPLAENKLFSRGDFIYQASATFDTEPINWSIDGTDSALFAIDGQSGAVTVKSFIQPDYEGNSDGYQVRIIATSGSLTTSQLISIPVRDVDEFPTQLRLESLTGQIAENIDTRRPIKIANIQVSDDQMGLNHLFLTGENKDKFALRPDGLYLATGADIDFEQRGGSQLRVTVDLNASGQRLADFATPQSINLRVMNIDEPGQLADWTTHPVIGGTLIAPELHDPDGKIKNLTYQWQSQILGQDWREILYAEGPEYTPTPDDVHKFLRVMVFYDDGHGLGKSVISKNTFFVNEPTSFARDASLQISPIEAASYPADNFIIEPFADIL